ncbi:MAG: hypothetical protein U0L26_01870 [Cellulosilyticum sp.]|nr:hypothetical protein [Cellulosilyticum sp.]
MNQNVKNLGKVRPTAEGGHNIDKEYDVLSIVTVDSSSYISRKFVPTGISIDDTEYWQPLAKGGINGSGETYIADEEDITLIKKGQDKVYQFKNRDSSNGMGYIILRKEKTLKEQIIEENTIYEIRYDFNLNGETLEIPEGCVLDFKGGSISNGSLVGTDKTINECKYKIFENIKLHGISSVNVSNFVEGNDLTSFFSNFTSEGCVISLNSEIYTADVSNLVIPKNTIIKGNGINETIIKVTNSTNSKFMFGMNYGVGFMDITLQCDNTYEGEVLRMSNEYTDSSDAKWALENVQITSNWVSNVLGDYKATAIAIYCREFDDEGNPISHHSLSYLRNFRNLKLKNVGTGIYVLIEQKTANLPKKIWCNSFLFSNLEIWAPFGIKFMTEGVDDDSGYFCFKDYIYQGGASNYGYYTNNGRENVLMNYLPWDTRYVGYTGGGYLFVEHVKSVPQVANGGFEGKGTVLPLSFFKDKIMFKRSDYSNSTFTGIVNINADGEAIRIFPDFIRKNSINISNKYSTVLDAYYSFVDYNGDEVIKKQYVQADGGTSPNEGSKGRDVREIVSLYDRYLGKTTKWLETSIPVINNQCTITYNKYGLILMTFKMVRNLDADSIYRIPLYLKDKNGNGANLTNSYHISIVPPASNSYDSKGSLSILEAQIELATGYIIVETDYHGYSSGSITIMLRPTALVTDVESVYSIESGTPIKIHSYIGNSFVGHTSVSTPITGKHCFRTDLGKPYWLLDQDHWVDSNGEYYDFNNHGAKTPEENRARCIGTMYLFNNKPYWWTGLEYVDKDGNPYGIPIEGTTQERPAYAKNGFIFNDTTIDKVVFAREGTSANIEIRNKWTSFVPNSGTVTVSIGTNTIQVDILTAQSVNEILSIVYRNLTKKGYNCSYDNSNGILTIYNNRNGFTDNISIDWGNTGINSGHVNVSTLNGTNASWIDITGNNI